jgi:UDPglucose 6-dehydrogenase
MNPDRVVIGAPDAQTFEKVAALYRPIKGVKVLHTDIRTAEMIKYAANAYLAMRVSFINEVADICESVGANVEKVSEGMGLDGRIGPKFLKVGPGFGGSCFPKDTKAFQKIAKDAKAPTKIISSVIDANDSRKINMAKKIIKAAGSVKGKNIGVLGIAFKANTDDIRDSSALVIIEQLLKAGAKVFVYDPEAAENAKKYFGKVNNLKFCSSTKEVVKSCAIISVVTEWPEFKKLDLASLKGKTLVDLRNLYDPSTMKGIKYISLGR